MQGSVSLFPISKGPSNLLINQFIFYIYIFLSLGPAIGCIAKQHKFFSACLWSKEVKDYACCKSFVVSLKKYVEDLHRVCGVMM